MPTTKTKAKKPRRYDLTREDWLETLASVMIKRVINPARLGLGDPIIDFPYRCAPSMPIGSRKVIGQCWAPSASADNVAQIFISPRLSDSIDVLGTLVHELIHAAMPIGTGHKMPFRKLALACGLEGRMKATTVGEDLRASFKSILQKHKPYPHGAFDPIKISKQSTRLIKIECGDCGCIMRITRKWIDESGLGICGCGGRIVEAD